MKAQLNLFIVDDDRLTSKLLEFHLSEIFGDGIKISSYNDGESCLKDVNDNTDIVVLDYFMKGKNGIETLKSIKDINQKTEVIMLSSNEDNNIVSDSIRSGALDYVIKDRASCIKISTIVNKIITDPIRNIVREFEVPKYVVIFALTFIAMGAVVYFFLKY